MTTKKSESTRELRDWSSKVAQLAQDLMRYAGAIRVGDDRWAKLFETRDELIALLNDPPARQ